MNRNYNDQTTWEQMLKERDEKDQHIALLKEQIRVADVAYQYLHGEHTRLVKANDEEEPVWEAMEEAVKILEWTEGWAYPEFMSKRIKDCLTKLRGLKVIKEIEL